MVEGIIAPLVEVVVAIAAVVLELCLWILIASIRPWRYVLSSAYRAEVREQMDGRGWLYRTAFLFGGFAALLLSVAVVYFLTKILFPPPEPTLRENVVEKILGILK
jgi:hypothetical protein